MITKAFMEARVIAAVAEARADEARKCAADVCAECRLGDIPVRQLRSSRLIPFWIHSGQSVNDSGEDCPAAAIHERLSLKGGEGKESR